MRSGKEGKKRGAKAQLLKDMLGGGYPSNNVKQVTQTSAAPPALLAIFRELVNMSSDVEAINQYCLRISLNHVGSASGRHNHISTEATASTMSQNFPASFRRRLR